jgi:23S rRNA-/tRNA-specific pseudouridylate synthase
VVQEIIVPETQRDKKIENFLTRNFPIGYVRKLFRKSGVRLNGRRAKAQDLVQPGDRVELFIPFEPETRRGASSRANRGPSMLSSKTPKSWC